MFEYETEVLNVQGKLRLSLVEDGKFIFDDLINKRATDGWNLSLILFYGQQLLCL
jgi:hypothetical protein